MVWQKYYLGSTRGIGMDNMTAKVSCFARAYHYNNNSIRIFTDDIAEKLLGEDYNQIAKSDKVLAAGGDAAHSPGGKRRSGVHEDALLVDKIPAGQGRTALDGEVCQRLQKARVAALVVLKDQDLARRMEGGVQILQKDFQPPSWGKAPDP